MEYISTNAMEKKCYGQAGKGVLGEGGEFDAILNRVDRKGLRFLSKNLKKVKEGIWYAGEVEWAQMRWLESTRSHSRGVKGYRWGGREVAGARPCRPL